MQVFGEEIQRLNSCVTLIHPQGHQPSPPLFSSPQPCGHLVAPAAAALEHNAAYNTMQPTHQGAQMMQLQSVPEHLQPPPPQLPAGGQPVEPISAAALDPAASAVIPAQQPYPEVQNNIPHQPFQTSPTQAPDHLALANLASTALEGTTAPSQEPYPMLQSVPAELFQPPHPATQGPGHCMQLLSSATLVPTAASPPQQPTLWRHNEPPPPQAPAVQSVPPASAAPEQHDAHQQPSLVLHSVLDWEVSDTTRAPP